VRRRDRETARAELVGIAERLFAHGGFAGTSLADIAREAGCSKAAVLYHFRTKQDLLVAVVVGRLDQADLLLDHLEQHPPGPRRDAAAVEALTCLVLQGRPMAPLGAAPAADVAAVLTSQPEVVARLQVARERLLCLLAGPHPSAAQRLRLAVAFYGLPLALPELADVGDHETHALVAGVVRDALSADADAPSPGIAPSAPHHREDHS
jgi:AcrR family transcriptional regulator